MKRTLTDPYAQVPVVFAMPPILQPFILLFALFLLSPAVFSQAGDLGGGVSWSFADGILTLSGEGAMPEDLGRDGSSAPWYDFRASILRVCIREGVRSISPSAFANHTGLTSVTIAESVGRIGASAFSGCSALTALYAGWRATPPRVGSDVFSGTHKDLTLYVPVLTLEFYEHWGGIPSARILEGGETGRLSWLYADGTLLLYGEGEMPDFLQPAHIPWQRGLEQIHTIILFAGITRIGAGAFAGCVHLAEVYLYPRKPPRIAKNAFEGAPIENVAFYFSEGSEEAYAGSEVWREFLYSASSSSRIYFSAEGGGQRIAVKENLYWTASCSASWLSFSSVSGDQDGLLFLTAQANSGPKRTTTLTLQGRGLERSVSVTQQAGCGLAVPGAGVQEMIHD
ncbi:MAG: leucine-rich repeat protein [Tannerellaceae bacterium]|jgi:hypothetical protein|nr:leucine-rich repeat protein [Tannerellaceae bacterium]